MQATGLWGVSAIAAGYAHTVAYSRTDGTVWAWGNNGSGQLGDGTSVDKHSPVQVTGLTGVSAIAARNTYTWPAGGCPVAQTRLSGLGDKTETPTAGGRNYNE